MSTAKKATLIVMGCLLVIGAVCAAVYFSYRGLYTNNEFLLLREISIEPDNPDLKRRITRILESDKLGIRPCEVTLPAIDSEAIRTELINNCPLIRELNIFRKFPDTLQITVTERRPVAILVIKNSKSSNTLLKIDEDGVIMPVATTYPGILPRITGLTNTEPYVIGRKTENKDILAFLEFLRERAQRPEGELYDVLFCHVNPQKKSLTLIMNQNKPFVQGARIILPITNIGKNLDKMQNILVQRIVAGQTISYIDATFNNVPVKP